MGFKSHHCCRSLFYRTACYFLCRDTQKPCMLGATIFQLLFSKQQSTHMFKSNYECCPSSPNNAIPFTAVVLFARSSSLVEQMVKSRDATLWAPLNCPYPLRPAHSVLVYSRDVELFDFQILTVTPARKPLMLSGTPEARICAFCAVFAVFPAVQAAPNKPRVTTTPLQGLPCIKGIDVL